MMSVMTVNTLLDASFGEMMANAGMNTLLGMGTVFVVLIFISFLISLFKYLPGNKPKKEEAKTSVDKAVDQISANEAAQAEEDDTELIAVISAAIAAYEGSAAGSNGGYVVRSIRRVR